MAGNDVLWRLKLLYSHLILLLWLSIVTLNDAKPSTG